MNKATSVSKTVVSGIIISVWVFNLITIMVLIVLGIRFVAQC